MHKSDLGSGGRWKNMRGLTLVELMVVVAVLSILASIAYPLYTTQSQKARRAEARVALQSIAQAQERFFTINGSYGSEANLNDPNGDGDTSDSMIADVLSGLVDRDSDGNPDNYAFAVTATTLSFSISADAQGAQDSDSDCAILRINHLGVKSAVGGGDKCW